MGCGHETCDNSELIDTAFGHIDFKFEVMQIRVPILMHQIIFQPLIKHVAGGDNEVKIASFGGSFGVHYIKPHLWIYTLIKFLYAIQIIRHSVF